MSVISKVLLYAMSAIFGLLGLICFGAAGLAVIYERNLSGASLYLAGAVLLFSFGSLGYAHTREARASAASLGTVSLSSRTCTAFASSFALAALLFIPQQGWGGFGIAVISSVILFAESRKAAS